MRSEELKPAVQVEVVAAKEAHCWELAQNMDEEGRELIRKGWDVDPYQGLLAAYRTSSLCWTALVDGEVAAMFGCAGEFGDSGYPWLTTAPPIDKVKLRFIRQSKRYIDLMRKTHSDLEAYVHEDNKPLIGWLKWAGFDVGAGRRGEFLRCVYRH